MIMQIPVTREELIELVDGAMDVAVEECGSIQLDRDIRRTARTADRVAALTTEAQCNGSTCGCPAFQASGDATLWRAGSFPTRFDNAVKEAFNLQPLIDVLRWAGNYNDNDWADRTSLQVVLVVTGEDLHLPLD